ncbi:hypothetical protein [Sphingomonas sp. 28-63-12]|uniref:hypothetical protein n=1 Tax=Sphingomonas sp. 28-63-12 TaxID=1970434 RepID=UPI000BC5E15D|nr:MAG: hypothetical protein B7Y47_02150 [Sphingomonas sp. 28-63-12]
MTLEFGRRAMLGGVTAMAGVALADTVNSAHAKISKRPLARHSHKIETRFVEFANPIEEFEAHFRMERDLVESQGTALTWYHWLLYLVPGDQSPITLLRYEGMEYSYFRKVADHTYRIHAHNVSMPLGLETNDYISSLKNPVTGETVAVPTSLLLNDPGTVHSPKGFRNLTGDGSYVQPYRQFRVENSMLKLDSVRTAPPHWPINHMESSIQEIPYESFLDKRISNLLCTSKAVYVFPYSKWLGMGDRPGHLLGFIDAYKIPSVDDFPDPFLHRMQREHPELLEPRWGEFSRAASFAY